MAKKNSKFDEQKIQYIAPWVVNFELFTSKEHEKVKKKKAPRGKNQV